MLEKTKVGTRGVWLDRNEVTLEGVTSSTNSKFEDDDDSEDGPKSIVTDLFENLLQQHTQWHER